MNWSTRKRRVGLRRLLALADLLSLAPPRKFDMKTWECNTTACAVGWACRAPAFRRAGLRLVPNREPALGEDTAHPEYRGRRNFGAVTDFFRINLVEAEHIFLSKHYRPGRRGPRSVARRIRQFVARKLKE